MIVEESTRVEHTANWYLTAQLPFDKDLIRFRYETIRCHFQGPEGLEVGPAQGVMTKMLLPHFDRLTIVEGSEKLLACIPQAPNLTKIHSLFEEFTPQTLFNTIIMEHMLEHIDQPVDLLMRAKTWLAPGGKLLAGVPNGNSIHRLAAVKMGLLSHPCELNARDDMVGHRRVYTLDTFRADIEAAGFRVEETGGVFFKPISNQQIQDDWSPEMIEGFYQLGKDFPEYAAEIYAVCVHDD